MSEVENCQNATRSTTINALSQELLQQIFCHLTTHNDLTRMRGVCTSFRSAADSNYLWRRFCEQRWPSCVTAAVAPIVLASGGYRLHFIREYLKQYPNRRPTKIEFGSAVDTLNHALDKYVFTFDMEQTSFEYMACTEAIAGLSITGRSLRVDHSGKRLVADLTRKPWCVRRQPYEFKTLVDLLTDTDTTGNQNPDRVHGATATRENTPGGVPSGEVVGSPDSDDGNSAERQNDNAVDDRDSNGPTPVQEEASAAALPPVEAPMPAHRPSNRLCMPEFKLKCGVLDGSTLKQAQLAVLEEGRNLRTRPWYRAWDEVERTAEGDDDDSEDRDASDEHANGPFGEAATRPPQRTTLTFSGQFALPVHVNTSMQHVLDVTLVGGTTERPDGCVDYEVTEVQFGPLFNTCNEMERMHCTAGDVTDIRDMLELKLGQYLHQS
eukprot:m.218176 g.218176  ORF g.218176 m.218176 type:complete len:437 (-) comp19142_c0_seq1:40-1350(-)